jgi:hypothetical protein
VPVPRLLAEGDGWLVMTYLPGTPLPELPDGAAADRARFDRITNHLEAELAVLRQD